MEKFFSSAPPFPSLTFTVASKVPFKFSLGAITRNAVAVSAGCDVFVIDRNPGFLEIVKFNLFPSASLVGDYGSTPRVHKARFLLYPVDEGHREHS